MYEVALQDCGTSNSLGVGDTECSCEVPVKSLIASGPAQKQNCQSTGGQRDSGVQGLSASWIDVGRLTRKHGGVVNDFMQVYVSHVGLSNVCKITR